MRNILKVAALAAGMFIASESLAQSVGKKVGNTAKKVGNKSAEIANKGASSIVDKKYDGKAGPNNETIYIDKNSQYYYINKKGKRIYLKETELRAKID